MTVICILVKVLIETMSLMIDEADLYAEVWVGRCCADSAEEVSNFVMKTLQYAQTTDDLYLSKIMFVGEDLGGQFYYQYGGDYKDMIEYLVPSSYNMNKLYDNCRFHLVSRGFYTRIICCPATDNKS